MAQAISVGTLASDLAIEVVSRSGSVTVRADDTDEISVDGLSSASEIRERRGVVRIKPRRGSRKLEIRCPAGMDLQVATLSGDVRLIGSYGKVRVSTVSGLVQAEHVAAITARTKSGGVEVERCDGAFKVGGWSGRIRAGKTGSAKLETVSGRVEIGQVAGRVRVRSVSGRIRIGAAGEDAIDIATVSGRVTIALPADVRPKVEFRSLSGRPQVELERGDDVRVSVRSVSGRLNVVSSDA